MPLRRVPLKPEPTAPHHTCDTTSTQCGASMRIGNGAPSSEANESSGASVPETSTTERAASFAVPPVGPGPNPPAMSANAKAGFKHHRDRVTFAAFAFRASSSSRVSSDAKRADSRTGSSNRFCTASRKSSALGPRDPERDPPRSFFSASAYRAELRSTSAVFSAWPLTRRAPGVLESFAAFTAAFRARSTEGSVSAARPASRSCLCTLAPPDHTAIHRSKPCGRRGHRGFSWSDAPWSHRATEPMTRAKSAWPSGAASASASAPSPAALVCSASSAAATRSNSSAAARRSCKCTSQLAASRHVSSTLCASSRMTSAPAMSTSIAARTDGSSR